MKIIPILVCLALVWPHGAQAQEFWSDTEFGMSQEEVRKLHPDAASPADPEISTDDAIEKLRLTGLDVLGRRFHVSFFFKSDLLTQVTLLSEEEYESFDQALEEFDRFVLSLRTKYGQEERCEVVQGIFSDARAVWVSGETEIVLFAGGILLEGFSGLFFGVNYRLRVVPGEPI